MQKVPNLQFFEESGAVGDVMPTFECSLVALFLYEVLLRSYQDLLVG